MNTPDINTQIQSQKTHDVITPMVYSKKTTDALEAARKSALKLASSILDVVGSSARLYYDEGSPNPTLDPAPILFKTPNEEKTAHDKRQLETLQKTVAAKKCWVHVSDLKREKVELERVLTALQGNPSIIVGTQLENRIKSMIRLKESAIDVAIHQARLSETELQALKMIEHEERVVILHAKIASVERLKKEQKLRVLEVVDLKKEKELGKNKNDIQRNKQMFFCDCFQGLSTWYSKCFIKRGWYPYPAEEWFVTESTKLQIWSPLAKSCVDYCDTTSFSQCHSILWEGGDWLEDKAKLAQLVKSSEMMPQTLIIPKSDDWDGIIRQDMLCCVPSEEVKKWIEIENNGGIKKFFAKDASRNFGVGVNVCRSFREVRQVLLKTPTEMFVVQEAIEPQLLIDGHRFGVRVYLAATAISPTSSEVTSNETSPDIKFYTYTDGWLTKPPKPIKDIANNVSNKEHLQQDDDQIDDKTIEKEEGEDQYYDPTRNISRDRSQKLSSWHLYEEFYPQFRSMLQKVLIQLQPKLVVKPNTKQTFELFGVDFLIGADHRIWLIEVNRSPRQMDSDLPMLHSLLNLVFQEDKTPEEFIEEQHWSNLTIAKDTDMVENIQ